jgi:transposase-like protein
MLTPDEHVLLNAFCRDHVVAECPACSKSFRLEQLGSDPLGSQTYRCLCCGADLSDNIRAHLTICAMVPQLLRQRVKEARETTQRLLKQGYHLLDRSDVLMRELEAALAELRARRKRNQT